MSTRTRGNTINDALGDVLGGFSRTWTVKSENIGKIFKEGGQPDILIEKADGWPIVLEAEVGNHRQAEEEACSRLDLDLTESAKRIHAVVAVVYPEELRDYSGQALRDALRETELEYALFTHEIEPAPEGAIARFPPEGWIRGDAADLVALIRRSSIPAWHVEQLADALEFGVKRAAGTLTQKTPHGSARGHDLAAVLGQTDDADSQTRKMAMTVLVDALIFHEALAESGVCVETKDGKRAVRSPAAFIHPDLGYFDPLAAAEEWRLILQVNYWPIFHTAREIVNVIRPALKSTGEIFAELWSVAQKLVHGGVTKSHDLTGVVFQRLIADRKFLATFYTRPASAALLAGLALPAHGPGARRDWSDLGTDNIMRIGDFACGTGTLLSTAYNRLGLLYERHGGDPKELHAAMMAEGLVGLDVLNVAVHLTAAMLAGLHPDTPFSGECLLTMPYGKDEGGGRGVYLGSLDLMTSDQTTTLPVLQAAARTAGGRGEHTVRDIVEKGDRGEFGLVERIAHERFDLVIMNPPFTRHGAREGDRIDVHNPAFAAFGADEEAQDLLATRLKQITQGGCGHGHAGLASYFTDLGHRKTAPGGTLALVLPLTCMSGQSWSKVRQLWREHYVTPLVVTISEGKGTSRSFSADTGMAEALFVAEKCSAERSPTGRALFAVLRGQPQGTLEGEQIAQVISKRIAEGEIRELENGPLGGTRIEIGSTHFGDLLDAPLPVTGAWSVVGINDMTLAQTAYQLTQGKIWIEGMPESQVAAIPISQIGDICTKIGPHDLDLTGRATKPGRLPQGPFDKRDGCSAGDAYPCLWAHDAPRERSIVVEPDSHAQLKQVSSKLRRDLLELADERWRTAARAHYNRGLQFNSQSLIVAMTPEPALGGPSWPTVMFDDKEYEVAFALWANSTLGLLAHWWMSNKSQTGRGAAPRTSFAEFVALDVRELSGKQLKRAQKVFNDLCSERYLPFDQIDEDSARAELDRRLLVDVLGLPKGLCAPGGPLEKLRAKLAAEPQIHGDKKTRVVLTADGETTEKRTDRD